MSLLLWMDQGLDIHWLTSKLMPDECVEENKKVSGKTINSETQGERTVCVRVCERERGRMTPEQGKSVLFHARAGFPGLMNW